MKKELNAEPQDLSLSAIAVALLAALARLAVVVGIAAWLVVLLIDELVTTFVYVIAAVLGLWFSS